MEFPVAYFEDNLIFTPDKKCWAAFEAVGFQYDFKSTDTKKSLYQRLLGFFWNLEKPVRLLLLPEVYTFHEHFERLKARASGPFIPYAEWHADETKRFLEEALGKEGTKYKLFCMINIDPDVTLLDSVKSIKDKLFNGFKDAMNKVERIADVAGLELFENELKVYRETEERVRNRLSEYLPMRKLKERNIEWIIRRNFWKGIGVPPQRYLWQDDAPDNVPGVEGAIAAPTGRKTKDKGKRDGKHTVRPRLAEFLNLAEGDIDLKHNRRMVKTSQLVGSEVVSGYSAYLTVSELPDHFYIPGHEYLYKLNDLDFPVGVSIYLDPMPNDDVKQKVRTKKMDIDDQSSHTASANVDLPISLLEARNEALILEKDLDDNKFPMFDTSFVFEVIAPTENELLERVDALRDYYKGMHLHLVNPAGEQWQLFNEFMPAGPRLCSSDYVHRISPHALAASMIAATKRLGDDEGHFIGTTGILNHPVFFDPSRAPRINKSGSGAFIGTLGGGKSFTANFLCYLLTVYGAKTLIFDPKGDRGEWKNYLHEFGDELDIVTLSSNVEDQGKLDCWGFIPDAEEAGEVSMNQFAFIAGIGPRENEFIYLTEAIEFVKTLKPERRSNMAVVEALEKMPEEGAKNLGRLYRSFSKLPFAKLMMCEGELNTINLDRRLTILQIARLDLPEAGQEPQGPAQIISVALMMSIAAFATRFCEADRNEFTVVIMDEFWALSGTREGKRLVERLIRTGRSFYAAVFIISQNADDLLDERIKNNLGFKFVFRSGDSDEVLNVLEFLDLEKTDENIAMVKNIQNGRPLFSDLDGQCGIVEILPIFDQIYKAFNTTPGQAKAS